MRRIRTTVFTLVVVSLLLNAPLTAQSASDSSAGNSSSDGNPKGFTSSASFEGSADSQGQVMKFEPSLGYNFNHHFGLNAGVPFYFVHSSQTSSTGGSASNGVGNAYMNLKLTWLNSAVNFASTLTAFAPTGDTNKGFSTGRATFDWNNRFERAFGRLTPFGEIGVGNTIPDSRFFTRPFTTLGFDTHFSAGASLSVWSFVSIGASGYEILPSGQQKVFSKLVRRGGTTRAGSGRHGRVFEINHETTGSSDIARDNGFSTWVDASPSQYMDLELGYNRSVQYDLNTVSFGISVNIGKVFRTKSR